MLALAATGMGSTCVCCRHVHLVCHTCPWRHTLRNTQVYVDARVRFGEFVIHGRQRSSNGRPRAAARGSGASPSVYFRPVNRAGASEPGTVLSTPQAWPNEPAPSLRARRPEDKGPAGRSSARTEGVQRGDGADSQGRRVTCGLAGGGEQAFVEESRGV